MSPEESNKWKVLKSFATSWWGVATGIVVGISAVVTTGLTVGRSVVERMTLPDRAMARVVALEAYDMRHTDLHATEKQFRDSVFAILVGADKRMQLFFDLYRCTEAGYDAHNCPLMTDELGIEPLEDAPTLQPSPGPGN